MTDSPPGSRRVTPPRDPNKPNFFLFSAVYLSSSDPLDVNAPSSFDRLSLSGKESLDEGVRESLQERPFGGELTMSMSPSSRAYIPPLVPEPPRRLQYPSSPSGFLTSLASRGKRITSDPPEVVPNLLTPQMMKDMILHGLPLQHRFQRWTRLFSLLRDGSSFKTFVKNVANHQRTLLVVQTSMGETFGAYASSTWKSDKRNGYVGSKFYGTGECFLFRSVARGKNLRKGRSFRDEPDADSVEVFKWTGANMLCQYFDAEEGKLAMGGGGEAGTFGLCLEDDFLRGSTGPTATFGNKEGLMGVNRWDFDILGKTTVARLRNLLSPLTVSTIQQNLTHSASSTPSSLYYTYNITTIGVEVYGFVE